MVLLVLLLVGWGPVERAGQLLERGRASEALTLLKKVRHRWHEEDVAILVARAYEAAGNPGWALNVLAAVPSKTCRIRLEAARLLISQGDLRGARPLLEMPCQGPEEARRLLLSALMELASGNMEDARDLVRRIYGLPSIYAHDAGQVMRLQRRLFPSRLDGLEARLRLLGGWVSNPLLGSPLDPMSDAGEYASGAAVVDGFLHLGGVPGPSWWLVEADMRGRGYENEASRSFLYLRAGIRAGLGALAWGWTARLLLHGEGVVTAARDAYGGSGLYSSALRMEVEAERGPWSIVGGAGRRLFAVMGRTRWELEGALARRFGALGLNMMVVGVARYQEARNDAYDLAGGTMMAVMARSPFRLVGLVSYDSYFRSEGAEEFHTDGERRDLSLSARGIWSHPLGGNWSVEVELSVSRRFSSAPLYEFTDFTGLVGFSWRHATEPWLGGTKADPVAWPPERSEEMDTERLGDLLRQESEARRGSSCAN